MYEAYKSQKSNNAIEKLAPIYIHPLLNLLQPISRDPPSLGSTHRADAANIFECVTRVSEGRLGG